MKNDDCVENDRTQQRAQNNKMMIESIKWEQDLFINKLKWWKLVN